MLHSKQLAQLDPILTSPIPPEEWRELNRPTIVCMLVTLEGKVLLVQPRDAAKNGWIFPQGGIHRPETLLQAALREAEEELGYPAAMLAWEQAQFVGKAAAENDTQKEYYVVLIPLSSWQKPRLNGENRKFCTPGGPGELAAKIGECSDTKKMLIQLTVKHCIRAGSLFSRRWRTGHAALVLQSC